MIIGIYLFMIIVSAQIAGKESIFSPQREALPLLQRRCYRAHNLGMDGYVADLPRMEEIARLEELLMDGFFRERKESMEKALSFLQSASETALRAYGFPDCSSKAERTAKALEEAVPELQRSLLRDAEAGFEGDPAARSIGEVILCYPIIRTLTMHRTAHLLYMHGIPLIPRMMNEVMHSSTGIDIHPGATIGERFFIDHGTGVVIGETTIIGNSVKLYQGVTLGALSIPKKGCGQILEGAKRHPTIEDNVTIYANATILGDITIGRNSVIASNAWIRESIPPDSIVKTAMPEIRVRPRRKE